jgi:predicted ATPase
MQELAETIMTAANRQLESPVAAVVAHWTNGVTCWFGGDYLNARVHLERALAIYDDEPDPATFKAATLDLPSVIMRFLALVLWPLGSIDQSRRLAREAMRALGERRALAQANALVHKAVFDGLCGTMLEETETVLTLAREHTMPLYVAAGTHLSGLARWRAGDRIDGLSEMRRGWALLHENDCYLCEPFWAMQVAMANAEAGQVGTALEILREMIVWVEQSGQHWLDAELHRARGEVLLRCDPSNASSAEDAFNKALEIARRQQTKTFELRCALGLARLYSTNGRAAAASDMLVPILVNFDMPQDLPEIEEARKLLKHKH